MLILFIKNIYIVLILMLFLRITLKTAFNDLPRSSHYIFISQYLYLLFILALIIWTLSYRCFDFFIFMKLWVKFVIYSISDLKNLVRNLKDLLQNDVKHTLEVFDLACNLDETHITYWERKV